jgi:two-component system, NtrC family, sensor kinase
MAEGGRKAKKRATATKRKKPVPQSRSGKTKSIKPKSIKPNPSGSKASNSRSQNARLKSELRAARDRQAASAEVMRLISASPGHAEQTLRRIAEIAERLFGASSVSLLIADGERWGRAIRVGAGSERIATTIPLAHVAITPQFMPGAVYLENRQVHVSDINDPAALARWPGLTPARTAGTRTMSGTPLRSEGRAIGALIVHRHRPVPFTEDELALLQSFADQAAIATENARLINETREALEQQTATAEILKVIASSPSDLQPVFEAIANSANRLIDGFSATVVRFIGNMLHLVAFTPTNAVADEALQASFPRPLAEFASFELVRDGETVQFPDTESEDVPPVNKQMARLRGYRSMVFTPLMSAGMPIGILSVTRVEPGTFAARHVQLLQTFADQAAIAIENAQLFEQVQARTSDLQESLEYQTATSDVLQVISRSTFDLQTVLDTLVESAYKLCGASLGLLYLRGDEAFECKAVAGIGVAETSLLFKGRPIRAGRGTAAERVIMTGEVESITDFFEDPEMDPKVRETIRNADSSDSSVGQIRSTLAVPMTRDSVVVGVMVIARSQTGPFPRRQIELLRTFADQAVIAIENARLFDEVKAKTRDLGEALQQQTATADVLKVISRSAFDLDSVLATLVTSAAKLCEAEKGVIFLREDNSYRLVSNHGFSPEFEAFAKANPLPTDGASTTTRAAASGATIQIVDVLEDPTLSVLAREYQRLGAYRTNLGVPLRREGETIGVFTLTRQEVRAFTERQIELVETFADQAVIAIENVRLFDEVKAKTADLSESLRQQTATADVLKVISRSAFDLQAVFDTLISSAVELSGAFNGTICLRDGDEYRYLATAGMQGDFRKFLLEHPPTPGRASAMGRVLLSGKVESIPDVHEDADYLVPVSELNRTRSVLGVPLLRNGKVEGGLMLARVEPGRFTQRQIELVQTFADQAVIAIENVRLFEQVQERTRELSLSLEELRTAQDRLVQTEKLASLGQLTAGIAHEIKNPLNFVNNFSALSAELIDELNDVLKPAALDDKVREEIDELTQMLKGNLEKVVQHGKRADSIVKNMLLHSREGSGEHRLADINAIVEESLNLAYHGARAERSGFNVTLQHDLDPAAGMIDVYPQEITRVFLNLISNGFYAATKRKEAGGEGFEPMLRATTKNLGNEVEIRIRDNGTGIPEEVKEKMFNPFFTTKPAGEGTGLGLSMSHDIIVKQHGGKIDVDTLPGAFTEFIITLPRAAAQLQAGGSN